MSFARVAAFGDFGWVGPAMIEGPRPQPVNFNAVGPDYCRCMKGNAKPIPEGFHTVTPRMFVRGAAEALEFYKLAFGATELERHVDPSGKVVNADLRIGDSVISLAEESPEWGNHSPQSLGGATTIMTLNVKDADAVWNQAMLAGAKVIFPIEDQFYGYRQGRLQDPFGHLWIISTHIEDVSPEEMNRRMEAWMKQQGLY